MWSSADCNAEWDTLLDFIIYSNLIVLNKDNEPIFVNNLREEDLDNISVYSSFVKLNQKLTSDHRCISFDIHTDKVERVAFRNPASTNWDDFCDYLVADLSIHEYSIKSKEELSLSLPSI